ncbi:MAG: cbb3-type cytochrome c oxidase N-terminal domain-containing protein [Bacteroidota bacterium]|nr:cbb3-type cytochrome c oxidase N-terminal domain-containing protein [Bacteroidota bacterium]
MNISPFSNFIKISLKSKKRKVFPAIKVTFFLVIIGLQNLLFSQTQDSGTTISEQMNMESFLKTATIIFALLLMTILWFIIVYSTRPEKESTQRKISIWAFLKDKLSAAAPLEKEQDILLEDNFDGIRELNNKVPPWFNILFYGTIIFAVIYYFSFHVFSTGKLSLDEYTEEMQSAELQKEILLRTGKLLTEDNVTQLKDSGSLQEGKEIFISKCSICHGRQAEGLVGPNLTDDYWIHGGSIKDIFKVVKYGVPSKGMITWQNQLSPLQIQKVSSYVLSLHGTNPPNAKAPQGEKFIVTADTTKSPM